MTDLTESKQIEGSLDVESDTSPHISTGKCPFLKLLAKQIQRLNCSGCSRARPDFAEVDNDAKTDHQLTDRIISPPKDKKGKKSFFGRRKSRKAKRGQTEDETVRNKAEGVNTIPVAPKSEVRIYQPRRRHPFFQQKYDGGFFSYFGEQELEEMIPKYNPPSLKKTRQRSPFRLPE